MTSDTTQPVDPKKPETFGLHEWLTILHRAASTQTSDPRYPQAAGAIDQAKQAISDLMTKANRADIKEAGSTAAGLQALMAGVPGGAAVGLLPENVQNAIGAGVVGFGRGASAGAVQPPSVPIAGQATNVIGEANPTASTIGDIAGTAATSALLAQLTGGLGPAASGAFVGGTYGGARGALQSPTGDRVVDGITGALGGALIGAALGYGGSKVANVGRVVTGNVRSAGIRLAAYFGAKGLPPAEAASTAEATLRTYLKSMPDGARPTDEAIEDAISRSKPLWSKQAPGQPKIVEKAVNTGTRALELQMGRPPTEPEKTLLTQRIIQSHPDAVPPSPEFQAQMGPQQVAAPWQPGEPTTASMFQPEHGQVARTAYNLAKAAGQSDDAAKAAAARAAGFGSSFDPGQALGLLPFLSSMRTQ